ncbi:pentapeptide repeat-containing protein [Paenibacillus sp. FSL K6-3182]|uniref:pentapeptide repeat-containing protein n=1 Tax=Paenibacillus sp. FSL K6-3182 TaxID=2921495 RepID=UPI0030CCDF04
MKLENQKEILTIVNSDVTASSFKNVCAEQVTLNCCNLSGMNMNDVNLTGLHISDANLSEFVIDGAQWGGAHFRNIGFGNPSQPDVEFNRTPVQLTNCNLHQSVFTDCNLKNAKFDNCDISGLTINGIDIESLIKQFESMEIK